MTAADEGKTAPGGGLAGRVVWLTRPAGQVDALRGELEARGVSVLHLPMLEIQPLEVDGELKKKLLGIDRYDLLFFISTNAARLGMERIEAYWPRYPGHLRHFAVGPSTADVLRAHGRTVTCPQEAMSSEALLALPELSGIEGRKALIVKGVGGRETLAEGLREKGAVVDTLDVYRRSLPYYEPAYLRDCLGRHKPDAIVITSAEVLDNFIQTFRPAWPEMRAARLFLSSERLEAAAREQGFRALTLMPGANDDAIVGSLEAWFGAGSRGGLA